MLIENALTLLKCIHADLVAAWIDAYVNDIQCESFEDDMDKAHRYKWLVSKDCTLSVCMVGEINDFIQTYQYRRINGDCIDTQVSEAACSVSITSPASTACTDTIYITTYPVL